MINTGYSSEELSSDGEKVGIQSKVEQGSCSRQQVQCEPENSYHCPSALLKKYAKGPFDETRPLLQFVTNLEKGKKLLGGSRKYLCHICKTEFSGSYTRVECHLTDTPGSGVRVCKGMNMLEITEANRLVQEAKLKQLGMPIVEGFIAQRSSNSRGKTKRVGSPCSRQPTLKKSTNVQDVSYVKDKEEADDAIAQFFFAHGLPFRIAHSPYYKIAFQKVCKAGASYVVPGEDRLRTVLLEKQYTEYALSVKAARDVWIKKGCSIVMDGWTQISENPLINVIVTCATADPYFLRAVDCSGREKDIAYQFSVLKEAIDEIGASNVVQVITDASPVCRQTGQMIEQEYRHIFWTPCCVHAMNNVLRDIQDIEFVKKMMAEARDVNKYICNHQSSSTLSRPHTNKEPIKAGDTRYASNFILLERILEMQVAFQTMIASSEWRRWPEVRTDEEKRIEDKIVDNNWWSQVRYIVSFLAPIVEFIRYVDSESPGLGEIYEMLHSMLRQMKTVIKERDPEMQLYEGHIRPFIQSRWDRMSAPIHIVAHAINPKWYAPMPGRAPPNENHEVCTGFKNALKKMFPAEEAAVLRHEWLKFVNLKGSGFSTPECIVDRATVAQSDPVGWWQMYEADAPNLCSLATRILSQVASASAPERNWATYSFILNVKRNGHISRRADKLVGVHSSLRLRDRITPQYRHSGVRWDICPEDAKQIDEDEERLEFDDIYLKSHDDDYESGEFGSSGNPSEYILPH